MIKPKVKNLKIPVVLVENIPSVGRRGEVVKVSPGYGRNYLIPSGKAVSVTADNLYRIEFEKQKWLKEELKLKEELQDLAKKLKKFSVKIEMNANEEGHLFGSVNENMVAEAYLEKGGFKLNPKSIDLSEVEKKLGVYEIKVKLHPEITATTKVHVITAQKDEESKGKE